jgi:hypothetical protein
VLDDTYRQITVKVKRRGVVSLYRHGYFATATDGPPDLIEDLANERIAAAAASLRPPNDISLSGTATTQRDDGGIVTLRVDLTIDVSTLFARPPSEGQQASLHLAIFAGDAQQKLIGELRQTLQVRRTASSASRSVSHSAQVATTGSARYAKVIVFDAATDRAGVLLIDRVR